MTVELPLDKMSVAEKPRLMDVIWEDLTRNPDEIPSPEWHREVLEECRLRAESGEEKFTDWEEAKEEIRRKFHEG